MAPRDFYSQFSSVIGSRKAQAEEDRKLIRNERMDVAAIDTANIVDQAVTEISVLEDEGTVTFSESLGDYQTLLDVLYTATGDQIVITFRDTPAGDYNEGDDTITSADWRVTVFSADGDFIDDQNQQAIIVQQMTGIEQLFFGAVQNPNIVMVQETIPGVIYNVVVDFTSRQVTGTNATIDLASLNRVLIIQSVKK